MEKILETICESKKILKINETFAEITTNFEIEKGINVRIFLKKENDKVYLTDNQHTLRYMNLKYELKSPDVKQCINDVVKKYKFKIEKGEILNEIKQNEDPLKRYNDLLICCATLANMSIFFEEPK